MRVAQLDAPPANKRRLMRLERLLQRAGEMRGRHLPKGCVMCAHRGAHEFANARAMARRNEEFGGELHEIELQIELPADLRALILLDTVPLVDRNDERPPALERKTEDARVLFGDGIVRVENENDD